MVTKYLKDQKTGQFAGSIGPGKNKIPTAATIPHTLHENTPHRALPVTTEATSVETAQDAYYFFFSNEACDSKYHGGTEEVITFNPASPAGLRDQIEEKIFSIQNRLAGERNPAALRDNKQTIAHLKELDRQLSDPNGLPKLIKANKAYLKIWASLEKIKDKTNHKWDLDGQAIQKIFLYGKRIEILHPQYTKHQLAQALEVDLKGNEPHIIPNDGNYAPDLAKLYPLIKKELNIAGIF